MPSFQFDPCFEVFSAGCGINSIACNGHGGNPGVPISSCVSGLTAGSTYWIRVYDYGAGMPNTTVFNICVDNCTGVGIDET